MALPTIRQLVYMIAVADTGRFNLAAERAHVSQPALSEQIAQLEHNLGAKLFERGRAGARLTPIGEEIVRRARKVMADIHELEDVVLAAEKNLGGLMRLGALPTVGPYLLPRVVPDLHAAYPNFRLYVREMRTIDLEARLRSGELDVILSTPPEEADGLMVEPLFEEPLKIGLPSDHRLAARQVITIEDLDGESILTLEAGHYLSERARRLAQAAHAQLLLDYEGTSLDGIRQMVGLGMGVSLFPALYVSSEMAGDPAVVVRNVVIDNASRWIALVWRASSPRTKDFLELAPRLRDRATALVSQVR